MRKIIGALVFTIMTCGCANAAMAQAAETVPASYPDPQCTKPDIKSVHPSKLGNLTNLNDESYRSKANAYNAEVKAYNRASQAYNSCIHAYIDTTNREIKNIQDRANADLKRITDDANASMKVLQDKIQRAVGEINDLAAAERDTTDVSRTGR